MLKRWLVTMVINQTLENLGHPVCGWWMRDGIRTW